VVRVTHCQQPPGSALRDTQLWGTYRSCSSANGIATFLSECWQWVFYPPNGVQWIAVCLATIILSDMDMKDKFFSFSWIRCLSYIIWRTVILAVYFHIRFSCPSWIFLNLSFGVCCYFDINLCFFKKGPCAGSFPEVSLFTLWLFRVLVYILDVANWNMICNTRNSQFILLYFYYFYYIICVVGGSRCSALKRK